MHAYAAQCDGRTQHCTAPPCCVQQGCMLARTAQPHDEDDTHGRTAWHAGSSSDDGARRAQRFLGVRSPCMGISGLGQRGRRGSFVRLEFCKQQACTVGQSMGGRGSVLGAGGSRARKPREQRVVQHSACMRFVICTIPMVVVMVMMLLSLPMAVDV